MRKPSFKRQKLSEQTLKEANLVLRTSFKDPRLGFVSFTRVEMNDDYSVMDLYWDTHDLNEVETIKEAMKSVTSKLRSLMGPRLKMRHTPLFRLFYDSQYVDANRISELLQDS